MAKFVIYKCNMCGKEIKNEDRQHGICYAGRPGYGSTYDGHFVQFELCTSCTDSLLEAFDISPIDDEDNDEVDWLFDNDFLS